MTQHQLVIEYIKEFGSILPAKQHGFPYKGGFFGSETSKRCRELRKSGILRSEKDGKFERFYLVDIENSNINEKPYLVDNRFTIKNNKVVNCCPSYSLFQVHAKDCQTLKVKETKGLW